MDLAFNLLLTLLLEIPIVAFFFRKRKRKSVMGVALFLNLVTWPLVNIIRFNTNWNLEIVEIVVVTLEGVGYWLIIKCSWKKAALISLIANAVSFIVTKLVHIDPEFFQKKVTIIR